MRISPSPLGSFAHLSLVLALSFSLLSTTVTPVQGKHRHHDLSSPGAKTKRLLHCLGHGPSARADYAKVQALVEAHYTEADEGVWTQLGPKEWGFSGHDTANADTWTPLEGAAQTGKDRVTRQHDKLLRCVKRLQHDIKAQQPSAAQSRSLAPVARDTGTDGASEQSTRRLLPDMFGGEGFKQIRQKVDGFFLKNPMDPKNAAQGIAPGPDAAAGAGANPDPSTNPGVALKGAPADADKGAVGSTNPADASAPKPDAPGTATPSPTGEQEPNPDGVTPPAGSQKLPPGIGPDVKSVAPALENDPNQKNLPKTVPGSDSATAGTLAAADDGKAATAQPDDPSKQPGSDTVPKLGALGQAATADGVAVAADQTNNSTAIQNSNSTASQTNNTTAIPGQLKLASTLTSLPDPTNPTNSTNSTSLTSQLPATNSACKNVLIRKEYSTLTRDEKKSFADAMKCVRNKPSRFRSGPEWNAADDWTLLHIRTVKYVHFTAYFTVFHRGFTAIVERDLNECGFTQGLPWVDWTKTADDPSTNPLFDADPEYGLGTNGQGDNSDCPWGTGLAVTDGALADHFFNAPFRHRLCRQFNNLDVNQPNPHFGSNCTTFLTANFVKGLGTTHDDGKFFDFSSALEISTHLTMHTCVGGNLAWLSSSPNDVVFHTHHSAVDNIFDAWQKKSPKNKAAFHGPKQQQKHGAHPPWTALRTDVINFSPLAENVQVQDLLDHESGKWGGRMCYRYDYNIDM